MLTVPEAARRTGRNPETIRRWIRSGKLRSQKVGTQHLISERALDDIVEPPSVLPVPGKWRRFPDGTEQPDWVRLVRELRESR